MTRPWLWSVGVLVLVAALSPLPAFAQGDGPRSHSKGMLTGTNVFSLTYMSGSGNVNPLDPSHTIQPDADFDVDLALVGYSRSFSLFGRTAVGSILVPVGAIDGGAGGFLFSLEDSARGFGDPVLQLDLNLIGAPAMPKMPDLLRFEPDFTLDLVFTLGIPVGEYDEDSPVNIGQNRWYGRVGMPLMFSLDDWVPGRRTTLEFTPAVWLFGDNDDFFGPSLFSNNTTLENDFLFQLDAHLTRDFTDDFWGSLDAVWYHGGESTIGNLSGGKLNDLGVGFTFGYQINDNLMLTTGYTATVGGGSEDLDLGMFRINLVYGWHPLIEGIKRLKDAQASANMRRYRDVSAKKFAEVFSDDVKGPGERLPDGSEMLQVDAYPLTNYTSAIQELQLEAKAKDEKIADLTARLERMEATMARVTNSRTVAGR